MRIFTLEFGVKMSESRSKEISLWIQGLLQRRAHLLLELEKDIYEQKGVEKIRGRLSELDLIIKKMRKDNAQAFFEYETRKVTHLKKMKNYANWLKQVKE